MPELDIDTRSAALLVMQFQAGILSGLAPAERAGLLANTAKALAAARRAGMPVIHVVLQFRAGFPEVSPRNALFSQMKASGHMSEMDDATRISDGVRPLSSETVVTKKRMGAFTGSDLEILLRSRGIDTLFLTGVRTTGVVEATALQALDLDYRVFVIRECCADREPDLNEVVLNRMLPHISTVLSLDDFTAALTPSGK